MVERVARYPPPHSESGDYDDYDREDHDEAITACPPLSKYRVPSGLSNGNHARIVP